MVEDRRTDLWVRFDRRIRLQFQGAKVTSDTGLLAVRELERALGLTESSTTVLLAMVGFGAVLGAMIGLAFGSVEGLFAGVWEKAAIGGTLGLLIGGVGGAFGGLFGKLPCSMLQGGGPMGIAQIAARALGWGAVDVLVGLGQGVMMRAPQKVLNGLLGGAVGGSVRGNSAPGYATRPMPQQ